MDLRLRLYQRMRDVDPKAAEYSEILIGELRVTKQFIVSDTSRVLYEPEDSIVRKAIAEFKNGARNALDRATLDVFVVQSFDGFSVRKEIRIAEIQNGKTVVCKVSSTINYMDSSCTDVEIKRAVDSLLLR